MPITDQHKRKINEALQRMLDDRDAEAGRHLPRGPEEHMTLLYDNIALLADESQIDTFLAPRRRAKVVAALESARAVVTDLEAKLEEIDNPPIRATLKRA